MTLRRSSALALTLALLLSPLAHATDPSLSVSPVGGKGLDPTNQALEGRRALARARLIGIATRQNATPVQLESNDPNAPTDFQNFPLARQKTNAILRQRDFRQVQQESWFDTLLARLRFFLGLLFSRVEGLLPQSHWFALALEWGFLALAAAAVVLWAMRVNRQQRVAIAVGPAQNGEWQKESDNWAERAHTEAARGDWREAVHCLYWSAIVLLEGQRMWRQNRARTPREYVILLEPGSPKQTALGALTRVFERIWYGLRPAAESDYQQASAMLEQLRAR